VSIGYEEQTGNNIKECFLLITEGCQPKTLNLLEADHLQRHRLMATNDISEKKALLESEKLRKSWTYHYQDLFNIFFWFRWKRNILVKHFNFSRISRLFT